MFTLWILWSALTLFVISLALIRKFTARNEDDLVHLSGAADAAISQQVAVAGKLDKIDHWGKLLTVVDVAFGIVLFAVTLYITWQNSLALEK
ncbi:MAG TPA: hypothetical protein VLW25_01700 [Bryobacteraceae bacterium]|jgi:uncharacterized membrane protein|nr:hypothetical protein [Bryobacteraceae bacterium]